MSVNNKRTFRFIITFIFIVLISSQINHFFGDGEVFDNSQTQLISPTLDEIYPYTIPSNTTLSSELQKLDISSSEITALVTAARPYKNLALIKPGTRYFVRFSSQQELLSIEFRFSAKEILTIKKINNLWTAQLIEKKSKFQIVTFQGVVINSLWNSAKEAQMEAQLIGELAEVFAWQIDFSREVQIGDRWRLSVEKEFVDNEFVGYGDILSAEYLNSDNSFKAVLFRNEGTNLGYFTPEGENLRKIFLKSPIEFARISSRFSTKRFHPVLKVARPHLGVDYAAPIGTPIRSVGDGIIEFAGWSGGGGKVIKIRHNSVYDSAYKHLNGFAKGVKVGAKVIQGQTIGFVGSTGLSTGPHLHFEFYINGRFVDPLGQKFPQANPISQNQLSEFSLAQKELLSLLPDWPIQ